MPKCRVLKCWAQGQGICREEGAGCDAGVHPTVFPAPVRLYYRLGASTERPNVMTGVVTRSAVVETVEATGTLQPVDTVEVGSQVTGSVKTLGADFNGRVAAAVSMRAVALSFCCAFAIGAFFGWVPARRAAALNPIEALRYE